MECPECGKLVSDRAKSCSCGWGKAPGKIVVDANRHRCEWMHDGERCHWQGTQSVGTHGDGPWYCREHGNCSDMDQGAGVVLASRACELRDYTADSVVAAARLAYLQR